MMNVVALQGRLTHDPELRQTMTGKQVAAFSLAVDRGRKDANGQSTADFINCIAWERSAEFVYRYFTKGQMMALTGRLQSRSYQAKDGTKRTAVEVVAYDINFCGSKPGNAQQTPAAAYNSAVRQQQAPDPVPNVEFELIEDDGDLPF